MAFIVIVACFAVQWFLNFKSSSYQYHWADGYSQWMRKQFAKLTKGHELFDMLLLVLPVAILTSLIFTIVYHLLGHVGYLILSLALLWYCTDVTILKSAPTKPADVFLGAYQKIFAPLLWYFVFGPNGLILYVAVATLQAQLTTQKYLVMVLGVLDWVPIRVVGLTFALAGNFAAVFKVWMKELFKPIANNQNLVATFGESAVSTDTDVMSLLKRVLLIWLVIMTLVTAGRWIGM